MGELVMTYRSAKRSSSKFSGSVMVTVGVWRKGPNRDKEGRVGRGHAQLCRGLESYA